MQSYTAKPSDIEHNWVLFDAQDLVLGRLSAEVAKILRGKHKPSYTPHMDCGDHVVIINAEKIQLTGNKREDKRYYRHTGYPGGIKETSPEKVLSGPHAERVIQKAVQRMVPRGPLGRKVLTKLHVYAGGEHPHEAQKPQQIDFASKNPKNKRAA